MPNHITTIVLAEEHVLKELLDVPSAEDVAVHDEIEQRRVANVAKRGEVYTPVPAPKVIPTFEKVVPSPPNKETGGCSGSHQENEICWLSWNTENWGTKWAPYSLKIGEGHIKFETAWSHPVPVIIALSKKFPQETITVKYADEDYGYNLGQYTIRDGDLTAVELGFAVGSDEATDWACTLANGMTLAEYSA